MTAKETPAALSARFERRPGEPTLEAKGITGGFATLRANDSKDSAIKPGEIHALPGENGADRAG